MVLPIPQPYYKGKKITSQDLNKMLDILDGLNFVEDHIEFGKVLNIPTINNGLVSGSVTFAKEFSSIPLVFLSLENVNVDVLIGFVCCSDVTTQGFIWNILVSKKKTDTYCNLNWMAIL